MIKGFQRQKVNYCCDSYQFVSIILIQNIYKEIKEKKKFQNLSIYMKICYQATVTDPPDLFSGMKKSNFGEKGKKYPHGNPALIGTQCPQKRNVYPPSLC